MNRLKENLFFIMAENRLIQEKREGKIPFYTEADVIEYAFYIKLCLDKKGVDIKRLMKLSLEQLRRKN